LSRTSRSKAVHDNQDAFDRAFKKTTHMTIVDLTKATVFCGAVAFLIYSFPVLGQIVVIGFLTLLWLCYARQTVQKLRRR
jgi:hypothetical protein